MTCTIIVLLITWLLVIFANMDFVDRIKELDRLRAFLDSADSTLGVIYGRRRVGKSTLVKKAIEGRPAVYFQADETQVANQLALLAKSVAMLLPGFDKVIYPDWYALLETLNRQLPAGAVVCLDEFPYLAKSLPSLPSVLQNFIDNASPGFKLILCGSSQQSMHSEVLNESSPLYGRTDLIMKLRPLSIAYISEAMDLKSDREAVKYYAVWGGIPRYWKLCLQYGGFRESFCELLLQHETTLVDEPNRLLRDDMRDLTLSRTILSVIGDGANRLSEIAGRIGKSSQELTGPLKKLIDMGYIQKETPFGVNPKSSKTTLYKIADNFLAAYYRFVAPNASLISLDKPEAVWQTVESRLPAFIGAEWEALCRRAVSGNVVDGVAYGLCSRWWGSVPDARERRRTEIEIDVVAESVDRRHLLLGECKWTDNEDAARVLHELRGKSARLPFIGNYAEVHYVLFLKEAAVGVAGCRCLAPGDVVDMLK